jgi:hypothetical protein
MTNKLISSSELLADNYFELKANNCGDNIMSGVSNGNSINKNV